MMDERQLSEWYDRFHRQLFVFILRFVGSKETAEDILHDAFVRLINYVKSRNFDDTHVRAFLFKVARNLCIDRGRRGSLIRFSEIAEVPSRDRFEDKLAMDELRERVDRLVAGRDAATRSIFYLKFELGMTYHEIAEHLGISERTAKRKMASLVSYLSEELERAGYSRFLSVLVSWILM